MRRFGARETLLAASFMVIPMGARAQAQEPAGPPEFATPGDLVTAIYEAVSADPDTPQDWDYVRTMFIEEAVVVLRTSRTATSVFSLDGFIQDFQQFMELPGVAQAGFRERIVRMRPWTFHDMAQVLVLYEAHIPGSQRPPQQGVDNFLLIKRDGRWWVAALTNEVVTADYPVPAELQG